MRNNLDFPISLLADLHNIAQISDSIVDLDFIVEKLFERRDIENLIGCWLRGVDDEL